MNHKEEQVVQRFVEQGRAQVSAAEKPSGVNPEKSCRTAEAVEAELRAGAREDGTPDLDCVDDDREVNWSTVVCELANGVRQALAEPGGKVMPTEAPPDSGIAAAIAEADGARRRLRTAIDGNKADRRKAEQLHARILGGREVNRSKAAWESEMKQLLAVIAGLGAEAPPAVRKLVPALEHARDRLDCCRAEPGRPAVPAVVYSPKVHEQTMGLQLAFGEVLSWSAATATDRRHAALSRIIHPRRRAEPAEPAATPAVERVKVPSTPAILVDSASVE